MQPEALMDALKAFCAARGNRREEKNPRSCACARVCACACVHVCVCARARSCVMRVRARWCHWMQVSHLLQQKGVKSCSITPWRSSYCVAWCCGSGMTRRLTVHTLQQLLACGVCDLLLCVTVRARACVSFHECQPRLHQICVHGRSSNLCE